MLLERQHVKKKFEGSREGVGLGKKHKDEKGEKGRYGRSSVWAVGDGDALNYSGVGPQSNELNRGPPELVQHFRL